MCVYVCVCAFYVNVCCVVYESMSALNVCESMSITTANVNLISIPETHDSIQNRSGLSHVGGHALPQSLYTFNPGH